MADTICVALNAKNLHNPDCSIRVGFLQRQLGNCNGNWQEKGNTLLIILFTKGPI